MSDDKPSAFQDARKGLGLLFRAARTVIGKLPKGGVEEVVKTSAREVGRAFENVATTVEREVFGKKAPPWHSKGDAGSRPPESTSQSKTEPPKPPDAA
jgi:hypothetical protein